MKFDVSMARRSRFKLLDHTFILSCLNTSKFQSSNTCMYSEKYMVCTCVHIGEPV
jgi:hypothetical protein